MKTLITPSQFKKLSHREKWDMSKTMKNVTWVCPSCNSNQGQTPTYAFMGEIVCSDCDEELTRRTGGGQNDPFNYSFYYNRLNKDLVKSLESIANFSLTCMGYGFAGREEIIRSLINRFPEKSEICIAILKERAKADWINPSDELLEEMAKVILYSWQKNNFQIYIDWLTDLSKQAIAHEEGVIKEIKSNFEYE